MTWKDVPGWFNEEDGWVYSLFAKEAPKGLAIEVGVCYGRSLTFLHEVAPEAQIIGVDLWSHCEPPHFAFDAELWQMSSVDAALHTYLRSLSPYLVYLDADHSYEAVKADIAAWWPILPSGGMLAGHDYGDDHPGVRKAVLEWLLTEGGGATVDTKGTSWMVRKP